MWTYPITFEMQSSAGYWKRVIAPKMDESVEKDGSLAARGRILGQAKKITDAVADKEVHKKRMRRGSR